MKTMDKDIISWILEVFQRRGQVPESLISEVLSNPPVDNDNNIIRSEKMIRLRSIDSEIKDGSVSETILDSLEAIEEMDRRKKIKVLDSMKVAYCAVAVDCTLKYLWGDRHKRVNGKYCEALNRIWNGKVSRIEMLKKSELVTDELREWRKVLTDSDVYEKLKDQNTRNDALSLTGDFVYEAMAVMVPQFLQLVARVEREALELDEEKEPKEKDAREARDERELKGIDESDESAESEDIEMEDRNAEGSHHTSVEELGGVACRKGTSGLANSTSSLVVADTSVPKGPEIQRKMLLQKHKCAAELRRFKGPAKITDSKELKPKTTFSEYDTVPSPEVKQTLEALKSSSIELQAAVEDPLPNVLHVADTVVAEMVRPNLDQETLVESSDRIVDDGSPEAGNKKIYPEEKCLENSKMKNASPLLKYDAPKKRRKVKKWSLEEEDALREGVKKYGSGNWKLILIFNRDLFVERTEVDLKDKWRNMMRCG